MERAKQARIDADAVERFAGRNQPLKCCGKRLGPAGRQAAEHYDAASSGHVAQHGAQRLCRHRQADERDKAWGGTQIDLSIDRCDQPVEVERAVAGRRVAPRRICSVTGTNGGACGRQVLGVLRHRLGTRPRSRCQGFGIARLLHRTRADRGKIEAGVAGFLRDGKATRRTGQQADQEEAGAGHSAQQLRLRQTR